MLLTEVPSDEEPSEDHFATELLDLLSEDNRERLALRGVDIDMLRRLCATQRGTRLARRILAEHTDILDEARVSECEQAAR